MANKLDFELSLLGDVILEDSNIKMIEDRDIYIQCFRQLFRTRMGEYFLNIDEGLDFEIFLGQREIGDEDVMRALQEVGEQVEDFVKYDNVDYTYDRARRTLYINFEALFADGFSISLEEEVIING